MKIVTKMALVIWLSMFSTLIIIAWSFFMIGLSWPIGMLFFLVPTLVCGIVIFIINKNISRPIVMLTEKITEMGVKKTIETVSVDSANEIGELAKAFNEMIGQLKDTHVSVGHDTTQENAALCMTLDEVKRRNAELENSKKAMLNILEDFEESKKLLEKEKLMYISERDRSEGILRYLHSIGEGIIATDCQGAITFVNLTAVKMILRTEGKSLIGKKYLEDFYFVSGQGKKRKSLDPVKKALVRSAVFPLPSYCYLSTDSGDIPVSGSFAPIIKNGKKLGVVSVFQDITERYNLEKEKDDFLSITAHQLRTPLTGIRWTLESLIDGDAGKLPLEAKNMLGQIFKNNQRLVTLVNDLLDVSRINMGKSKEELEVIDISAVIQESIKTLEGLAKERGVKVAFKKKNKENLQVKIGPKHFFQAMENLISNSLKYTPRGGKVNISVGLKDQKVIIAVADTGIGIPKKEQNNIFRKFFRASNAVLAETDGSGLGLNVVKSFIEEGNGKIRFESEEGQGTIFFIELPLA